MGAIETDDAEQGKSRLYKLDRDTEKVRRQELRLAAGLLPPFVHLREFYEQVT